VFFNSEKNQKKKEKAMDPVTTTLAPDTLCLQIIVGLQQLFTQALAKATTDMTKDTTNAVLNISRQLGVWFDRHLKLLKNSSSFSSSLSSSQISNLKSSFPISTPAPLPPPSRTLVPYPVPTKQPVPIPDPKISGHSSPTGIAGEGKKPLWKELLTSPQQEVPLEQLLGPGSVLERAKQLAKT
jgi:hypothetical protein